MSQLTLNLPETLHQQLINIAQQEGISLNQYIVYALTRQAPTSYTKYAVSPEEIDRQQQVFADRVKQPIHLSDQEITTFLNDREEAEPEEDLTSEITDRFQQLIRNAAST